MSSGRAFAGWSFRPAGRGEPASLISDPAGAIAATIRPATAWRPHMALGGNGESWRSGRPFIPKGRQAKVTTDDGTSFKVRNGRAGIARSREGASADVGSRRYRWEHTSATSAIVERDGRTILEAGSGAGTPRGGVRAALPFAESVLIRSELDRLDTIVCLVFLAACGPAGRDGVVRNAGRMAAEWARSGW